MNKEPNRFNPLTIEGILDVFGPSTTEEVESLKAHAKASQNARKARQKNFIKLSDRIDKLFSSK